MKADSFVPLDVSQRNRNSNFILRQLMQAREIIVMYLGLRILNVAIIYSAILGGWQRCKVYS